MLLSSFFAVFSQKHCDTTASRNRNYPYLVECYESNKVVSQTLYSETFQKGSETLYSNDSVFRVVFFRNSTWRMHYVEVGTKKQKKGVVIRYDSLQNVIARGNLTGIWLDTLELYTYYSTGETREHFFQLGVNGCKIKLYESFHKNGSLALKGYYNDYCEKIGVWYSYDEAGNLYPPKKFSPKEYESKAFGIKRKMLDESGKNNE